MSAPVLWLFTRDGREFVCAWHPGWDRAHPANVGQSHGCCPECLAKLDVQLQQPREVPK